MDSRVMQDDLLDEARMSLATGWNPFDPSDYEKELYEAKWPDGRTCTAYPNAGTLHLLDTGRVLSGAKAELEGVLIRVLSEEELDKRHAEINGMLDERIRIKAQAFGPAHTELPGSASYARVRQAKARKASKAARKARRKQRARA